MAYATITLYHKGCEFDVDIEADIVEGGNNRHGSDEPAWIEIGAVCYSNPARRTSLSQRLIDWIESKHMDYVDTSLVEAYEQR